MWDLAVEMGIVIHPPLKGIGRMWIYQNVGWNIGRGDDRLWKVICSDIYKVMILWSIWENLYLTIYYWHHTTTTNNNPITPVHRSHDSIVPNWDKIPSIPVYTNWYSCKRARPPTPSILVMLGIFLSFCADFSSCLEIHNILMELAFGGKILVSFLLKFASLK